MRHGHDARALSDYTLGQIRLYAREAARAEKRDVLSQAMAIGIAFGGEKATMQFIGESEA